MIGTSHYHTSPTENQCSVHEYSNRLNSNRYSYLNWYVQCAMSEWIVIVGNKRCSLNLNYNSTTIPALQLWTITESRELFSQIKAGNVGKPRKLDQNITVERKKSVVFSQHVEQCLSNRCIIIYILESEIGAIGMMLWARLPNRLHEKKNNPSDYFANLFIN